MRTIFNRAYTIYSSERYLHGEIKYIEATFEKVNNYPKYVINQLNREVKLKHTENMNIECSTINQTALNEQEIRHLLILPYAVVYYAKYPEEQCREDYTGEKGRHLIERVKDRSGKDARSYLFKHSVETKYKMVRLDDFKIIGKG